MVKESILTGKTCPYCLKPSQCIDSVQVYGRSYGFIWYCEDCHAWVGCHKGGSGKQALGRLANAELREMKKQVHAAFDPIWQKAMRVRRWSKSKARNAAYRWLAGEMNMDVKYCHVGMFDVEQCYQAIDICNNYWKKRNG